jgi:hypothetical protein
MLQGHAMKRPLGLTIIAAIDVVGGAWGVCLSILFLLPSFFFSDTTMAAVTALFSTLVLVLGIGLWRRWNLARLVSIFLGLASLLAQLIMAVHMPFTLRESERHLALGLAQNAFTVWTIIYLLLPKVRLLFLSPS